MRDIAPARKIVKLSQAATEIVGGCPNSICCGTAGTFTGVDMDGNTFTNYPLQQGYNPIRVKIWSAGTASDVWGLWNNT